jgi:hypothetical protein
MEAQFRRMQRATVARSALDVIALIFLGCGFAFWGVAFWQLLAPPTLLSLLSIQAVVLALVYSLAAPLLLSMLVPTTPAGQLLQKTQWRTIGFPVIVGCALFLSYQAEFMLELWLTAQTAVREAGFAQPMAISLMIAFVVVPALAWVQLTPERWLQQIQQAHQVKKLDMQQRGELALIRAALIKAEQRALIGYVNLLPLERDEHFATIRGLVMGINDQQHAIARTMGVSADLERTMMGDSDIATALDSVKLALEQSEMRIIDAPDDTPAETGETRALTHSPERAPSPSGRAGTAPAPHTKPHKSVDEPDRRGSSQMIPHYEEYTIAYEHYHSDTAWSVKMLAEVLGIEPETAGKRRRAWEGVGLVSGEGLSNGRYRFIA